ncbi:Uncharacterised protein [Mycobacteroides abscessus subsp. abscessus]|nr:Uncharacterised protein [Mycobacteroides abscessus subsp. abscessus]
MAGQAFQYPRQCRRGGFMTCRDGGQKVVTQFSV